MAKKNRTLQELLNVDINKLTNKTISEYFKAARENVRKTVNRWKGREYKSGAYYSYEAKTGGKVKPDFRGAKTLQEKKKELAKAVQFLSDPTRTVKGWEKEKRANIAALSRKSGINLTPDEYDHFFKAYERAKKLDSNIANLEYKYDIFEYLIEEMRADNQQSTEELAVKMQQKIKEIYENKESQHQENERDISEEFF